MKHKVFFGIGIRIIILFTLGMFFTFIPEHLRNFFGDILREEPRGGIDSMYIWGARHYWYFWMMASLCALAFFNLTISIITLINKNYNTSKWL